MRHPDYLARHAAATVPTLADLLADPSQRIRHQAAMSLALLATPAKDRPSIVAGLPQATRDRAADALRAALDDADPWTSGWAAAGLLLIDHSSADRSVPVLLGSYRRAGGVGGETGALARSGPAGARIAIEYLDEPDANYRRTVISIISGFADSAMPILVEGLLHRNPRVREGILRALAGGKSGSKVRPAIVARLRDPDSSVRLAAAATLATLDPKEAGVAVPVLAELAFDREASRRLEALRVLYQLGPVAHSAVPDLMRRMHTGDDETKLTAAEALWAADRFAWKSFVPAFVAALKSEHGYLRQRAIAHLRDVGPSARSAVPALKERFADADPMIRVLAAEAAFAVDREAGREAAVCLAAVLRDTIQSQNRRVIRTAIRVLDKIGPPAKAAVPALVEVARSDPEAGFAPDAAVAAIRIDAEQAAEAYDMFRAQLRPGNPEADEEWLYRVPQLKKLALPLLPELIGALHSKTDFQRAFALDSLQAIGPDASDALPVLREMANGKSPDASHAAAVIKAIEKK
jgi:HEAT repeat protein